MGAMTAVEPLVRFFTCLGFAVAALPAFAGGQIGVPSPIPASRAHCEFALLRSEFGRPPNDLFVGFVTESVPLTAETVINAYSKGIFPWGMSTPPNARWYRPPMRGVLDLNEVHIGRSDRRFLQRALGGDAGLSVTFDSAFRQVIEQCSQVPRMHKMPDGREVPDSAWISQEFIDEFTRLHELGIAHSVEVWRGRRLVGGLYGVMIGGLFTGESMFHLEPDVTKLALHALIERLKARGHKFIDTQMALGLVKKWGAKLIPREEFEERLRLVRLQNPGF